MAGGHPRAEDAALRAAGPGQLIAQDHDGLGQVERGEIRGGNGDQAVAQAGVLVGEAPVFGAEDQRHLVFARDGDQLPRQPRRGVDHPALAAGACGGADDILKRRQGRAEVLEAFDPVHHIGGRMGGQGPDFGEVEVLRGHHPQLPEAHIAHGARRRADVFRVARLLQHHCQVVQVHPLGCGGLLGGGTFQPTISSWLKK